ncbi:prepilin-type N-terminal cleavage/methylation domain-containing protein [Bacillus ectoiniformans]|uniref:PilW family protein n=1 Tax=Bacillus ectoiniformans TaxID=1494429 RepID=UPI00195DF726|nr:prepilin-type N-terminal cleavage/methylation domain-containing protein [Bacillus ectoiniformans]MBM7648931.1 prepilin-type N-terminal cleavage/methylation domain-containing protein [Bacillus ectoiniformans]
MEIQKRRHWPALLKARIYDNTGVTLVELLITLVIMAIISPIVYNVFLAGQQTYNRQVSEVQFREDADYITTMVMNEFFATPFDFVEKCDTDCIQIVDSKSLNVEKTGEGAFYKIEEKDKESADTQLIPIRITSENEKGIIQINGETLDTESDLTGSSVERKCEITPQPENSGCESGVIVLTLKMSNSKTKQEMTLKSEFGF